MCVCFKKFHEKLWSFRIRGTFFLLNLSVSSISEEKTIFKIYPVLLAEGEDVYFGTDEYELQELQQTLKNQIY